MIGGYDPIMDAREREREREREKKKIKLYQKYNKQGNWITVESLGYVPVLLQPHIDTPAEVKFEELENS